MEVVEISREERDVYLIPQNFVDTGTILGGTVKLRNAVEAAVLAVGSAVPLFYLPLAFNIRLMIVIAMSVPLDVFGVVGIGGDSLTQFAAHWFRFMKRRRIVTPTPQGNLEADRHRHLRFISKRYRVVYYDDSDTLPHNAQVLQLKADRHGKLVKRQTLYDLLPIEKIENGILHTTDDRYIKILEIEPINFLLHSPREQRSVIYSFASLLKVSPVRLIIQDIQGIRAECGDNILCRLGTDAFDKPGTQVSQQTVRRLRNNFLPLLDLQLIAVLALHPFAIQFQLYRLGPGQFIPYRRKAQHTVAVIAAAASLRRDARVAGFDNDDGELVRFIVENRRFVGDTAAGNAAVFLFTVVHRHAPFFVKRLRPPLLP